MTLLYGETDTRTISRDSTRRILRSNKGEGSSEISARQNDWLSRRSTTSFDRGTTGGVTKRRGQLSLTKPLFCSFHPLASIHWSEGEKTRLLTEPDIPIVPSIRVRCQLGIMIGRQMAVPPSIEIKMSRASNDECAVWWSSKVEEGILGEW
jgi:hypothetical protein